jgi:hypothetical protein
LVDLVDQPTELTIGAQRQFCHSIHREAAAMWDFRIGQTLGIMARTWPFILLRLVVYFVPAADANPA